MNVSSNVEQAMNRLPKELETIAVPAGLNAAAKVLQKGVVREFFIKLVRRTGNYLRAIFINEAKPRRPAVVGVGVDYASYLEEGTQYIRPRRVLADADRKTRKAQEEAFRKAFRRKWRTVTRRLSRIRKRRGRI